MHHLLSKGVHGQEKDDDSEQEAADKNASESAGTAGTAGTGGEGDHDALRMSVGMRVRIERDGKVVRGMIASKGVVTMLVATDAGEWETQPLSEVGVRVFFMEESSADEHTGVVGFAYDHTNTRVVGMLLGNPDETALGGKMGAYCSHIPKPEGRGWARSVATSRSRCKETHSKSIFLSW